MASSPQAFSSLDAFLRDMVKQNAALLELLAYGQSVFPEKTDFLQEHENFVARVGTAFNNSPIFVISAMQPKDWSLPVVATFDGGTLPLVDPPHEDLFRWLLTQANSPDGVLGKPVDDWLRLHKQQRIAEMWVLPYVVTRAWGPELPGNDMRKAVNELRADNPKLEAFLHTTPLAFNEEKIPAIKEDYFRAFTCIGITREEKNKFKGDLKALLETLMVFYQMSWSNFVLIKKREDEAKEKQKEEAKIRDRADALTFAMIRDPIEQLIDRLREAQQPLNRLSTVLSPVRGLFAADVVREDLFEPGVLNLRILRGSYQIETLHHFTDHGEDKVKVEKEISRATEQIAAIILSAYDELPNARTPLWNHLQYFWTVADTYQRVSQFLLARHPAFRTPAGTISSPEVADLFLLAKYWFHRANRTRSPMRLDFLAAGLSLLAPDNLKSDPIKTYVDVPTLEFWRSEESVLFWVSSTRPMQTISGLAALCREIGKLTLASISVSKVGENQETVLSLDFNAEAKTVTNFEKLLKDCRAFEEQSTPTSRGGTAFGLMELLGGVPEWDPETHAFSRAGEKGRASVTFEESGRITLTWLGLIPEKLN